MLTVAEQTLPGDDGGGDAVSALHEALGAGGKIVDHPGQSGTHARGVDDVEIGHEALAQKPAVEKAPGAGRLEAELPNRLLERDGLAVAHPVGQQMRGNRRVADLRNVRTGIRRSHDRARTKGDQELLTRLEQELRVAANLSE